MLEASWRDALGLKGRFHPEHSDDLQVIVHDGGPRLTETTPELMWVRVLGQRGVAYEAEVLNTPHNLKTVAFGSKILFLALPEVEHPFRVTEKYLTEREIWDVVPCDKCGFPELFDAPSDLISKLLPTIEPGDLVAAFTTFCPFCRGVQVVDLKDKSAMDGAKSSRKWWQFWK